MIQAIVLFRYKHLYAILFGIYFSKKDDGHCLSLAKNAVSSHHAVTAKTVSNIA